uniref:Uncharacterized protein n=1 Tax=Rhizophora mucronata TaxID=61149 RepID=A0A2P2PPB5_RHIMU
MNFHSQAFPLLYNFPF